MHFRLKVGEVVCSVHYRFKGKGGADCRGERRWCTVDCRGERRCALLIEVLLGGVQCALFIEVLRGGKQCLEVCSGGWGQCAMQMFVIKHDIFLL